MRHPPAAADLLDDPFLRDREQRACFAAWAKAN